MKTKLYILAFSTIAILAPVKPLVLIAVLSIILDTCFGIWRSVKKNGWVSIRSRRLSHTISKSLLYSGSIVFIFLLEKFVISDILGHFIAIDLVLTKAFTFFCVITEVKSINESYFSVTGVNVWDKFIAFLKRGKEQLDEYK
ncbi:Bacteriophage holin family [uncultured Caudovirales phage]|uniref:Bacteriophage holin family n=1 Tax=uncultured Caudovirales phage TaxID=2100421 RepID=A0A6J5LML8_9CAUD|nr:Bacteriophage holin family [uncultured Caudovirales phage]